MHAHVNCKRNCGRKSDWNDDGRRVDDDASGETNETCFGQECPDDCQTGQGLLDQIIMLKSGERTSFSSAFLPFGKE